MKLACLPCLDQRIRINATAKTLYAAEPVGLQELPRLEAFQTREFGAGENMCAPQPPLLRFPAFLLSARRN